MHYETNTCMEYHHYNDYRGSGADIALSIFAPDDKSASEAHAIITVAPRLRGASAAIQTACLGQAADALARELYESGIRPVMARWLLSDAANTAALLPVIWSGGNLAVSAIEQPPLSLAKAALWIYFMPADGVRKTDSGLTEVSHGAYRHIFAAGESVPGCGSQTATAALLSDLDTRLVDLGTSLADGCLRTWFFVRDVDYHYMGVVRGRNEIFDSVGLTPSTHFIASTGIEGGPENPDVTVKMDAWAACGLDHEQISYIKAPQWLNPTYQYGVAFERATAIDYGDRRHLLVSGTASIDSRGEIVAPGDIEGQTRRMLANVEALLEAGQLTWHDVAHTIIYIRDMADGDAVERIIDEKLPCGVSAPRVIVRAPVCRPGWLVEMECMAVGERHNPEYAPF